MWSFQKFLWDPKRFWNLCSQSWAPIFSKNSTFLAITSFVQFENVFDWNSFHTILNLYQFSGSFEIERNNRLICTNRSFCGRFVWIDHFANESVTHRFVKIKRHNELLGLKNWHIGEIFRDYKVVLHPYLRLLFDVRCPNVKALILLR